MVFPQVALADDRREEMAGNDTPWGKLGSLGLEADAESRPTSAAADRVTPSAGR